jgi:putative mRNA 3-end processing factor
MEISFLGAAQEVGRSSILLSGDDKIMLDCGLKIHSDEAYPYQPPARPDFAIISHAHLDHSGFAPALFRDGSPEVICTPPTAAMAYILAQDSMRLMEERGEHPYRPAHVKRLQQHNTLLSFRKWYGIGDSTVTFTSAGHIPGAAIVDVETGGKRIVYSGDFKMEETKTTFPTELPPANPDALIIESTYSKSDHPPRKALEKELGRQMNGALSNGGTVLFPAFAIGRTQELARIIRSENHDVDIYIDGMGWKVNEALSRFSHYIKDFKRYRQDIASCKEVAHRRMRDKLVQKPCVIIATAGMLQGGPALGYLLRLSPQSRAIFTGYSVPDTNGYNLLKHGFVEYDGIKFKPKAPWSYLDFSAHAGRSELFGMVEKLSPQRVFCVHGDSCPEFAEELKAKGFDACAPKLGEAVNI